MEKIYVGKIVNTHGIKGELRILSDFDYKENVFQVNNKLIIDDKEYIIKSHRIHKNYDMVTLNDYKDINEVLFLLKKKVYVNSDEINLSEDEVLDEELINYTIKTIDNKQGKILEIFKASKDNKILRVLFDKEILIPVNSPMIKMIDKEKKEVLVELIEGMWFEWK